MCVCVCVCVCVCWGGYISFIRPLILMQLQSTNICSVRIEELYLIYERMKRHRETHINNNIVMKQNKGLNGDLKPEHKKTVNRTTMSPTTDINSQ